MFIAVAVKKINDYFIIFTRHFKITRRFF